NKLEIYVANADGSEPRQVTYLDAASFAPYFFPDGKRIIFASSWGSADPHHPEFDLYAVDTDGTDLERITWAAGFDGFPVFSPDGGRLVFGSNRNGASPHETDMFVARWVPGKVAPIAGPADELAGDIAWLADDAREGRGIGTAGLEAAATWLAGRMKAIGVEAGMGGDYRQPVEVMVDLKQGPGTSLALDGVPLGGGDFVPAAFSGSGRASGATVFAGWGIRDQALGIDDYARLDVKGKIVVVRRFLPEGKPFDSEDAKRRYSDLWYKAFTARERGAIGVIAVEVPPPPAAHKRDKQRQPAPPPPAPLPRLEPSVTGGDVGIPVVVVTQMAGAHLAGGRHQAAIAVELRPEKRDAHNIVGVIRAGAPDKLPGAVLVGAHYDHLGLGGRDSLEPDVHAPHNGADDNASGTAALLQVGRALVAHREKLRRDVWLVAFTAEESGVIGSTVFARNPPRGLAIADLVAMLNMDMVGRMRGNQLSVLGGESAAEWSELVEPACAAARVSCSLGGSGYGPSDQTPFYAAGVPVLHFFTGTHTDYHKTTDDADKINAIGAARVAQIVAQVAQSTAGRDGRLTYKATAAPLPAGDARSFGGSLGTIPEYADNGPGVLLSGVRPGGPADQAGVRRGDRIVGIGATQIRSIQDMMFVLRQATPGQPTSIAVIRDGKRLELPVRFGAPMGR
ncbi:MAG TPA: M28 family peptidase, partial [Kofleriaceae bacterium]|nr:M28 family peptidase [Kofleriaceae bacterium]